MDCHPYGYVNEEILELILVAMVCMRFVNDLLVNL